MIAEVICYAAMRMIPDEDDGGVGVALFWLALCLSDDLICNACHCSVDRLLSWRRKATESSEKLKGSEQDAT